MSSEASTQLASLSYVMLTATHSESKKQTDSKAQRVSTIQLSDIDFEITNAEYVQAKKGRKILAEK